MARTVFNFSGIHQRNVLGTFRVIRGFADLHTLAAISKPIPYEGSGLGVGTGYQRHTERDHIEDLKTFLETGQHRFFPEIVLGMRLVAEDDTAIGLTLSPERGGIQPCKVRIATKELDDDRGSWVHRIDGNHRLEAAVALAEGKREGTRFEGFTTAPFCFVILESDRREDDELAEAMLFNLINSKALKIVSEHSLRVLMRDDRPADVRFKEDSELYLTGWIRERISAWPGDFLEAMGETPLSQLRSAAQVLLRSEEIDRDDRSKMERETQQILTPLQNLAVKLRDDHEAFVLSEAFLPIATEVYSRHTTIPKAKDANTEAARTRRAERWLHDFARWFDRVGAVDLPTPADPCVLWTVFKRDFDKRAGQVFVAMSFRQATTLKRTYDAIKEAVDGFNEDHPNSPLSPVRIDKYQGESYDIPAKVFSEIDQSRLVIADLTDEKQNVYCEIGYAKAKGIPFILTFHQKNKGGRGRKKNLAPNRVHFDLVPYRYIEYEDPMDLRDRLREELKAWHDNDL